MPTDFQASTVVSGLANPTDVDFAPDGRMFFSDSSTLKVRNTNGTVQSIFFTGGLIHGMAVDSSFASNGYVYLFYVGAWKTARLTRVQVTATNTLVNPSAPETVLIGKTNWLGTCGAPSNTNDCIPVDSQTHNIDDVISDTDGTLWLANGDNAGWGTVDQRSWNTQNEQSYAGKMIHVDRNGNGLSGHAYCPTNTNLTHVCTKIAAIGHRNPWRFTERPNGAIITGDVGWETREEVDIHPGTTAARRNFGWPCYEGSIRTPGWREDTKCAGLYAKEGTADAATSPIYDYAHVNGTGSVTMGPTNTFTNFPSTMQGDVFFADYVYGWIKRMKLTTSNTVSSTHDFATGGGAIVAMDFSPQGELHVVDWTNKTISKIRYTGTGATNRPPVAAASANPTFGPVPLSVAFSSAGSSDPDGQALTYNWDFGDGTADSTAANPTHSYTSGTTNRTATLTVRDPGGLTDTATVEIQPGNTPPNASATQPGRYRGLDTITLTGSATDTQDGTLPNTALSWNVSLIHVNHEHVTPFTTNGNQMTFQASNDHDADSYYEVKLTATDSRGLKDTETIRIDPQTIQLTLASSPSGASITYGGSSFGTPITKTAAIGYVTTISAPLNFSPGGVAHTFGSWSDGGARQHNITVPATNTTLTANYEPGGTTPPSSGYSDAVMGTSGLLSYWRLGEASGTVADDAKGTNNGTYVGALSLGQAGALTGDPDTAPGFDGVNDEVTFPGSALALTTQGTLEGFFKWTNTAGVLLRDSTSLGGWILAFDHQGLLAYRVGGTTFVTTRATSTLRDGNWHHIALTANGGAAALYVDGTLVRNASGAGSAAAKLPWHGMRNGTLSSFAQGQADEIAIYNRALTASEIADHYAARSGGGTTDPPPAAPTGLVATAGNGSVSLNWADNSESDLDGYNVYRSTTTGGPYTKVNTSVVDASQFTDGGRTNGTTYYYVVRAVDNAGHESGNSNQSFATPSAGGGSSTYSTAVLGTSGLLSYWRLGEASGTTADDAQGANNGTFAGGPQLGQAGALTGDSNTAAGFDGLNDEATFPGTNLQLSTAGTIEGFFKWTAGGVLFRDSTTQGGWILAFDHNGLIAFRAGGVTYVAVHDTSAVRDGNWHHIVLTKNGGSASYYIDGVPIRNVTGAGSSTAVMPWHAMRNGTLSSYAQGTADEIAIYNRALTAAEVQQHYAAR